MSNDLPLYKIQPMTGADLDRVASIEAASFPRPWTRAMFEQEINNPVSFSYTLKEADHGSDKLLAYVVFWMVQGEAHILDLAVTPELRARGLATILMEFVIEFLRDHAVFEVFLEVRKTNAAARRLYANLGFKESYERKNYYGDEDAVVMTLSMDDGRDWH